MLAQLEVKEINSRTFKDFQRLIFKDFPVLELYSIQGLSRIIKACGHPVYHLWNNLSLNIRESSSLSIFRKNLLSYYYNKFNVSNSL